MDIGTGTPAQWVSTVAARTDLGATHLTVHTMAGCGRGVVQAHSAAIRRRKEAVVSA